MVELDPPLVLASASPQRRKLLERLGVAFTVRPTGVAELEQGDPAEVAVENALRKARAARTSERAETILGVDTLVALGSRIYGKPADETQAQATIAALAGATHEVISGVALLRGGREQLAVARTEVRFRECDSAAIERYVASGEWRENRADTQSKGSARRSCARSTATTRTSWAYRWRGCWTCFPSCSRRPPEGAFACKYAVILEVRAMVSARLPAGYAPAARRGWTTGEAKSNPSVLPLSR